MFYFVHYLAAYIVCLLLGAGQVACSRFLDLFTEKKLPADVSSETDVFGYIERATLRERSAECIF